MRKTIFTFFVFSLIFLSFNIAGIFAQVTDNDALFAIVQRQLAGDPSTWSIRWPDPNNNLVFVPVRERPQDIVRREEIARTTTSDFDTSSWYPGEILRRNFMFDSKSETGRFLRDLSSNG